MKVLRCVCPNRLAGMLAAGALAWAVLFTGAPATAAAAVGQAAPARAITANPLAGTAPQLTRVGSLHGPSKPAGVPDDYVVTPNGYFSPACVQTVHPGDKLKSNGMIERASGLRQSPVFCAQPRYTLGGVKIMPNGEQSRIAASALPKKSGWVQSASYVSSIPIGRIVARWTVPSDPRNHGDQVIYFFPGLEQLPNVQSILQPVLGWNGYGDNAWTLASWNCCVDGTTFHSDPVPASAGDAVVGDTYADCAPGQDCKSWNIDARNVSSGQTSSLTTDPYADLTWVFGGVLEVYNLSTCDQYPGGPITFHDIRIYDRNQVRVAAPSWNGSDTSGIDPPCNYGLTTTPGSATIAY